MSRIILTSKPHTRKNDTVSPRVKFRHYSFDPPHCLYFTRFIDRKGNLHFHSSPVVGGLVVVNSDSNVNVDSFGRVSSFMHSWIPQSAITQHLSKRSLSTAATLPSPIDAFMAFMTAINQVGNITKGNLQLLTVGNKTLITGCNICTGNITSRIALYEESAGELAQVYDLAVPLRTNFFNAFVATSSDLRIVAVSDWTSNSIFSSSTVKQRRSMDGSAHAQPLSKSTANQLKRRMAALNQAGSVKGAAQQQHSHQVHHRRQMTPENATPAAALETRASKRMQRRQVSSQQQQRQSFSYNVVPINADDFLQGRQIVQNPADKTASPLGWHDIGDGSGLQTTTIGNNVIAQENSANSNDPVSSGSRPSVPNFNFNFAVDDVNQSPQQYVSASISNLFFVVNAMHDIMYQYGFNEAAGNFQMNNFEKGGKAGDAIVANAQDGSGVDNANFATPPDGTPGEMRMFLFDTVAQGRDGALDNDVIVHEFMHGVSNRLTGGSRQANCLKGIISSGMDEGWSDFMALAVSALPSDTRQTSRPLGVYVMNSEKGVRRFPYSTNLQINPHKFSDLADPANSEPHNLGEIWTSMLFEVYWNLIDKHGFEQNVKSASSGKGNTIMIQLVMSGLQRQPCDPNFISARDGNAKNTNYSEDSKISFLSLSHL